MIIYLLQHGEAVPEEIDPLRPLTEKGKRELKKTALDLKQEGAKIDEIWHSTKLRSRQSAEIISQILRIDKLIEKDGLKPKDPVAPVAALIRQSDKTLLIAGHLPFLAKLASLLKTGSEDKEVVAFKQGTAVKLEIQ
jgi:phosphohistidine phosphatase